MKEKKEEGKQTEEGEEILIKKIIGFLLLMMAFIIANSWLFIVVGFGALVHFYSILLVISMGVVGIYWLSS